jgi:hypothetical protein
VKEQRGEKAIGYQSKLEKGEIEFTGGRKAITVPRGATTEAGAKA